MYCTSPLHFYNEIQYELSGAGVARESGVMAVITEIVCNAGIVRAHCLVPRPARNVCESDDCSIASEELGDRRVTMCTQLRLV